MTASGAMTVKEGCGTIWTPNDGELALATMAVLDQNIPESAAYLTEVQPRLVLAFCCELPKSKRWSSALFSQLQF